MITLTPREKQELKLRAAKYTAPYFHVVRARMILLAAQGFSNDQIAQRLDTPRQIVSRWRQRFFTRRLAGQEEMPRPGRPRSFPPELVVQIKALACELPTQRQVPLARWSVPALARYARDSGMVATISDSTLWRWLHEDAIRPWQHRGWIFPRDPDFAAKAGRLLDLYEPSGRAARSEKTTSSSRLMKRPAFKREHGFILLCLPRRSGP